MRVAIADDDEDIRDQIVRVAREGGHDCATFTNGRDMLTALGRETFDVVLLDWNMSGYTGLEILERVHEQQDTPPTFILLTSRSDKDDVVRGLEAGASDYIIKPESSEVIRARIEAAARKIANRKTSRFQEFGPYRIDNLQHSIELAGSTVKLTAKEFQLAVLFFQNIGRPLSRGYIFSQVWGGMSDIETRTLDMHMSRVRSKLELRPENGFVVQTVFGFGYRMDNFQDVTEPCETADS